MVAIRKAKELIVFDILGPMYHYDEAGWDEERGAIGPLLERIEENGYAPQTITEESAVEEEMLRKEETSPIITPGFVETILYARRQGKLPVIITTGTEGNAAFTLEAATRDYACRTGETVTPEGLIPEEHRTSTLAWGSKRQPETWRDIVSQVHGRDAKALVTYEDTPANLAAAMEGLGCDGYHVVSRPSGLVEVKPNLYKGTVRELYRQLERRLG